MAAAPNKTQATAADVDAFLDAVADPVRRADGRTIATLMARLSGEPAAMWGPSIIGFGRYRYKYDSGREGEAPRIGFSPRKTELVLYVLDESPRQAELLEKLGKHRTGKSCLYIKRLSDIDPMVLDQLVAASLAGMDERYPRD